MEVEKTEIDLVIVGSGPSGLFGTFCAGLRDIRSITLETMDTPGGQLVELYPEKTVYDVQGIPRINARELANQMIEQAKMFKGEIVTGSKVTDIIPRLDERYDIEVNGDTKYTARAVLLSTGIGSFIPAKVEIPGEDDYFDKGVSYGVRLPEDFKDKRVIIIGAGDSAFDWAEELSHISKEIHIIQRSDRIRAAERTVKIVRLRPNVELNLNTIVQEIVGDGLAVRRVILQDKETKEVYGMEVDKIIVAIGHKTVPNTFKSLNLDVAGRYIKVNEKFETNVKGIYAVGDVANDDHERKVSLIAVGGAEAYMAVNNIKRYLEPKSSLFGGHSSNLKM